MRCWLLVPAVFGLTVDCWLSVTVDFLKSKRGESGEASNYYDIKQYDFLRVACPKAFSGRDGNRQGFVGNGKALWQKGD